MPLPFAPPPSQSKVYADLKNIKLTDLTADQFDTLKGALFAQGVDGAEDEMRRLDLLGQVSNQTSSSGPIPGTATVLQNDWSGAGGSLTYVMSAGAGEVWRIMNGAYTSSGGSSTITVYVKDDVLNRYVTIASETVNDGAVTLDPFKDIYIDENLSVRATVTVTDSTSEVLQLLVNRVR